MPHRIDRRRIVCFLAVWAAALAATALAQTGLTEADRAGWEEFLRTAKIADAIQLGGPEAVTSPWKLSLAKGDVTRFGLWKDIDAGPEANGPDRWRFEIAAYRLDVLLGLGMVPPTVEKAFQGRWGSVQLWMNDTESIKNRLARGGEIPAEKREAFNRNSYLQRCFDSLIGNDDRNVNNILLDKESGLILIDHSRAFRTAEPFGTALAFGVNGLLRDKEGATYPFLKLPRAFVDKLKTLDAKTVKDAVKGRLTSAEIKALLVRRDLILKEVEGMVRERGEADVLY